MQLLYDYLAFVSYFFEWARYGSALPPYIKTRSGRSGRLSFVDQVMITTYSTILGSFDIGMITFHLSFLSIDFLSEPLPYFFETLVFLSAAVLLVALYSMIFGLTAKWLHNKRRFTFLVVIAAILAINLLAGTISFDKSAYHKKQSSSHQAHNRTRQK